MTRRQLIQLMVVAASLGTAQASETAVSRMLRDVSRALQARNAALFLSHFDRDGFDAYPQLEANVVVLMEQKELGSSIRIVEIAKDGEFFRGRVDWLLQVSPLGRTGMIETRRSMIDVRVAPDGKKWRIVGFAPVDFLRPS